jgi:signal transduction histidine kinase
VRVWLVSDDRRLYATCRKVLVKLQDIKWDLAVVPSRPSTDGELYIWDYETDPNLAGYEGVADRKHIFIVDRKNLADLRSRFETPPIRVVLKPVNRALLESFITDAAATQERGHSHVSALRQDRDEILQELLESNLKLQEIDQARSTMVARGVQELRAPLMAFLGYCKLLFDQQLGPLSADQRKVIQRMQQSAQRLFRLSNPMFQSSLGSEIRMQPQLQAGDIEECIERAVAETTPFAEARGLTIQRDVIAPAGRFFFDPDQITQVLFTVLDNAVRFTPKGGRIGLRAYPTFWDRRARNLAEGQPESDRRKRRQDQPNAYRVEIHDSRSRPDGEPGDRTFIEYAEPDPSAEIRPGAHSGLSLSMCQQIIESHHGHILLGDEGDGSLAFVVPYLQDLDRDILDIQSAADRSIRAEA